MDYADWGAVLGQACSGGRVDYDRLLDDPRPLDRFLARIASVGPVTTPVEFPSREHRLAYAINCYNATILRSILALAGKDGVPSMLPAGLEGRHCFRIDGRLETPQSLYRRAIALAGEDWRVAMVLCNGHLAGPPLHRRVFLPDLLDGQLTQAAVAALANPQVVFVTHGLDKQLQLCRPLFDAREALVRDYRRKTGSMDATILAALLDVSDRLRREELNAAVGYEVALLPENRMVNSVEPPILPEQQSALSRLGSFTIIRPSKE